MSIVLSELIQQYLNDKRYPDADPEEMRAQVKRLFEKYSELDPEERLFMIDTVLEAKFGEPPSLDFEPMDLNIENILKEKGIL